MSIHRLIRLAELKHLSQYSVEELITSFSLYQEAIISTKNVRIHEENNGDDGYVLVSEDVERLNELLAHQSNIMLPCADCGKEQPFVPQRWGNPQKMQGPLIDKSGKTKNIFEITPPRYVIGENQLNKWDIGDSDNATKEGRLDDYIRRCVNECKDTLLEYANEVRKDFYCAYINHHRVFVQFRIYDPIEPEDIKESSTVICSADVNDQKAYEAYECLHDCLIIQKVGQYPSIADMELIDINKYQTILGKESYREFKRAIGLYSHGIGCGSFVYLRRIFERLIEEKHQECVKANDWDEQRYKDSKVKEKIKILEEKGYSIIPKELSPIKEKLYGVLSKGVHESTDAACAELFPCLQFAIECILEEQLNQKKWNERIKKLNSTIGQIPT